MLFSRTVQAMARAPLADRGGVPAGAPLRDEIRERLASPEELDREPLL